MREPSTNWREVVKDWLEPEVFLGMALFAPIAGFLIYTRPGEMAFIILNKEFHALFTVLIGVVSFLAWYREVEG